MNIFSKLRKLREKVNEWDGDDGCLFLTLQPDGDACQSSSSILFTLYPSDAPEEKEGQMCS